MIKREAKVPQEKQKTRTRGLAVDSSLLSFCHIFSTSNHQKAKSNSAMVMAW